MLCEVQWLSVWHVVRLDKLFFLITEETVQVIAYSREEQLERHNTLAPFLCSIGRADFYGDHSTGTDKGEEVCGGSPVRDGGA